MPYYMATRQVLMSKLLNELKKKYQDNCNVYLITTLQLTKLLSEWRTKKKKLFEVGGVIIIKKKGAEKKKMMKFMKKVGCDATSVSVVYIKFLRYATPAKTKIKEANMFALHIRLRLDESRE